MSRQEDFIDAGIAYRMEHSKPMCIAGSDLADVERAFNRVISFEAGAEHGYQYAQTHPNWISVEERLPEEGQVVLIHTKGGSVSTACYTDGRFDITELFQAINVTHWMPIVPPRKEE